MKTIPPVDGPGPRTGGSGPRCCVRLLTGEGYLDQTFGRPLAVRLRGASVSGRLNLGGCTVRCPLELYGCYLGGRLGLAKDEASDISLRGSHLAQRLSARQLRLTNDLNLTGGFRCHGSVDLRDGHVGSDLNCGEATLSNPGGGALTADGLTVGGHLVLRSAEVTGEVRLVGARVGGSGSHRDSDKKNCSRCTDRCCAPATGSAPASAVSALFRSRGASSPARYSRNPRLCATRVSRSSNRAA